MEPALEALVVLGLRGRQVEQHVVLDVLVLLVELREVVDHLDHGNRSTLERILVEDYIREQRVAVVRGDQGDYRELLLGGVLVIGEEALAA